MKQTKFIFLAGATLVGCATKYPTTTLDRELALKLADKTPIVVTAPAPTINVNNFGGSSAGSAETSAYTHEAPTRPVRLTACTEVRHYDAFGNKLPSETRCFGAE